MYPDRIGGRLHDASARRTPGPCARTRTTPTCPEGKAAVLNHRSRSARTGYHAKRTVSVTPTIGSRERNSVSAGGSNPAMALRCHHRRSAVGDRRSDARTGVDSEPSSRVNSRAAADRPDGRPPDTRFANWSAAGHHRRATHRPMPPTSGSRPPRQRHNWYLVSVARAPSAEACRSLPFVCGAAFAHRLLLIALRRGQKPWSPRLHIRLPFYSTGVGGRRSRPELADRDADPCCLCVRSQRFRPHETFATPPRRLLPSRRRAAGAGVAAGPTGSAATSLRAGLPGRYGIDEIVGIATSLTTGE